MRNTTLVLHDPVYQRTLKFYSIRTFLFQISVLKTAIKKQLIENLHLCNHTFDRINRSLLGLRGSLTLYRITRKNSTDIISAAEQQEVGCLLEIETNFLDLDKLLFYYLNLPKAYFILSLQ